jgi:hypothetical protein
VCILKLGSFLEYLTQSVLDLGGIQIVLGLRGLHFQIQDIYLRGLNFIVGAQWAKATKRGNMGGLGVMRRTGGGATNGYQGDESKDDSGAVGFQWRSFN